MERLQKVIANAGVASRRKAEELIKQGLVTINGNVVYELGTKVSSKDVITVDGVPLAKEEKVYYVLNKPRGVVSTVNDDLKRKTVLDLFLPEDKKYRIYPVGRLDYDTAGVLLLTNDGQFANRLSSPEFEVEKEYLVRVHGIVSIETARKLAYGVLIDGYMTKRAYVRVVDIDRVNNSCLVKVILREGKNHQVKKMFEVVGHEVKKLTRVRFGVVKIDYLGVGTYRKLRVHEVKQLMANDTSNYRSANKNYTKK